MPLLTSRVSVNCKRRPREAWKRHKYNHLALKAGLESIGLSLPVAECDRLPNSILFQSNDIKDTQLRAYLLDKYDLEIGAGLGALAGEVWRIGQDAFGKKENVAPYVLKH